MLVNDSVDDVAFAAHVIIEVPAERVKEFILTRTRAVATNGTPAGVAVILDAVDVPPFQVNVCLKEYGLVHEEELRNSEIRCKKLSGLAKHHLSKSAELYKELTEVSKELAFYKALHTQQSEGLCSSLWGAIKGLFEPKK